jgi:hypothetical protein
LVSRGSIVVAPGFHPASFGSIRADGGANAAGARANGHRGSGKIRPGGGGGLSEWPCPAHDIFGGGPAIVIVIPVDMLDTLFDLTPAEARLAALVGSDLTPRIAAESAHGNAAASPGRPFGIAVGYVCFEG